MDNKSLLVVVDPVLADAQATNAVEACPDLLVPPQAATAASPHHTLVLPVSNLAKVMPQPQEGGRR